MKHPLLKPMVMALSLACTQAMAATKTEPPLVDLGAEMKAKSGDLSKPSDYQSPNAAYPANNSMQQEAKVDDVKAEKQKELKEEKVHWSYSGDTGPKHWGDLSTENSTCKAGKNQSPIDLRDKSGIGTAGLPQLDIHYRDVPYKVINSGHTLQVNYPLGSYIKVGSRRYELMHLHFHTQSEHKKEGFNYPMEVQLVHKDGDDNFAIMGILFQEGEFNEQIQTVLDHLPKKIGKQEIYKSVRLNPVMFMPGNTEFYKYSGSLTTPPCTEGVYWMVFKHTLEASAEQIQQMNEVMGENSRPVQAMNARGLLKSWADQLQEPPMYEFY